MKLIATTMRIDSEYEHKERRDCIDQRWYSFFSKCDIFPFLVPNNKNYIRKYLSNLPISGILLTGGNTLKKYGGEAQERDETENMLIQYAIDFKLPLLGICRGMQTILDFFDQKLITVEGHAGTTHNITINANTYKVNSYHNFSIKEINEQIFSILAKSEDLCIESIKHKKYNITGIMWHPEREESVSEFDIKLFKEIFYA